MSGAGASLLGSAARAGDSAYRPEVDGLRCVAVVAVILYHAGIGPFPGGYVGVDIFFVISGYLITSILAADLATGQFSFRKFYERRARRIFPALFFVMACCVPFAWAWLTPGQLREFFQSVVAVTLFLSNLYFWLKSGYFGANAETLPLLHTWSLSVEEQFYVVFPIVLMLLWRFWRNGRSAVLGLLGIASLAACLWYELRDPSFNFFFAPTRAWELLAGSMVALHRNRWNTGALARPAAHEWLSALGIGLVLMAVCGYDKDTPFPGRFAIAPVLGTALILCFCTPRTLLGKVLASRGFVGIGLVSYSAYLWHQPLFAFARTVSASHPPQAVFVALIALTGVLSCLSWRFVEMPFRQPGRFSRPRIFTLSLAASLCFVGVGVAGHLRHGAPGRFDQASNQLAASAVGSPKRTGCHTEGLAYLKPGLACRYFAEHVTWAVLGDSHGVELAWALAEELKPNGRGVLHLTDSGCQPALTFESNVPGCSRWLQESLALLEASPELHDVVLVFRHSFHLYGDQLRSYPAVPDTAPAFLREQGPQAARAAYWNSFAEVVRRLKAAGKNVHVVEPIPELGASIDRLIYKRDLFGAATVQTDGGSVAWYERRNREVLLQLASLRLANGVNRVGSRDAVCDATTCRAVIDGEAMYFDDNHLSVAGARRLARLIHSPDLNPLAPAIKAAGEPGTLSKGNPK